MTSGNKERASARLRRASEIWSRSRLLRWSAYERERCSNVFSRRAGLSCKRLNFVGNDKNFLPWSPACAASIVAFNASRLVWLATFSTTVF